MGGHHAVGGLDSHHVTDTTLYTIPCEHFLRIVREHHEVALPVLEHLAAQPAALAVPPSRPRITPGGATPHCTRGTPGK